MSTSRVEIQESINAYRAGLESKNLSLNDPMWDDKFDPRYISLSEARNDSLQKLNELEKELAEAKARREKGRSLDEINKEIKEKQSNLNELILIAYNAETIEKRIYLDSVIRFTRCYLNALQRELSETIEEEAEKKKRKKKK